MTEHAEIIVMAYFDSDNPLSCISPCSTKMLWNRNIFENPNSFLFLDLNLYVCRASTDIPNIGILNPYCSCIICPTSSLANYHLDTARGKNAIFTFLGGMNLRAALSTFFYVKTLHSWHSNHSRRHLAEMFVKFDLFSIIQIYRFKAFKLMCEL